MTSATSVFTGQFSKFTTWRGRSDASSHVWLHLPTQERVWSRGAWSESLIPTDMMAHSLIEHGEKLGAQDPRI
jgi:hypothetical protein